jgi:hypothetical protein
MFASAGGFLTARGFLLTALKTRTRSSKKKSIWDLFVVVLVQ